MIKFYDDINNLSPLPLSPLRGRDRVGGKK